jgi:hypothetical protein
MAGFDRKLADEAFSKLFPRLPRFNVDEVARFA